MMRESTLLRAALFGSMLSLAACSGGGDTSGDTGSPITGVAAKGLMAGTTVEVFLVDADGFADTDTGPLQSAVTDQVGRFELASRPDPGPLLLRTRGGSYLDESDPAPLEDKRRITLGPNEGFEALLPAGQNVVAITPYSQMLVERARAEADPGRFIDFFDVIRQRVTGVLGFDPVSDLPADPINPGTAGAAARAYAMSLGGFAQQVNSTAIRLGIQPNYDVVRAVQDDMIDGVLDGQNNNEPVIIFINDTNFALPVFDFNRQIERFRNNNFGAYGAAQLVNFDENVLSGPVTIDNTPPLVDNFAFAVEQGGTFVLAAPGLLDGTSDVDGDQLSVETTPVTPPNNGAVVLNADGSFEYTHDNTATTADSFQFAVIDGNGGRTIATTTITITPVANNRVYNTGFLELELLANDDGSQGEFRFFQDRGLYDLSLAVSPRVNVTVGPFESLGGGGIFTSDSGQSQFNSLFVDPPGEIEPVETLTVNRGADGVFYLDPEFNLLLESDPEAFERGSEDTTLIVPVRDDIALTTGLGFEENFQAISSAQAPQGAYISGSLLGRISNEFNMFLEIGLEQSTDFDVSRLEGDYGFAGLSILLEGTGRQTVSPFRVQHSPDATGVAVGEGPSVFDSMVYTPDEANETGMTEQSRTSSGGGQSFVAEYVAQADGTLDATFSRNGSDFATPTGFASPDGEIVVLQEVVNDPDGSIPSVESLFQVGVRRPAGTVDLSGQSFRWSMLRIERSAQSQNKMLVQFNNVPVSFSTAGTCAIERGTGQNTFFADRPFDDGPLFVDVDDFGSGSTQNCSFTTGTQGTVTITVPGDPNDANDDVTYEGFIAESGDIMVLTQVRNDTGFLQRGLVIGYLDTGVTTPDNRQPEVTVQPASASVADGGTLDLAAILSDPDNGPAPTSVQWLSTIGAFTSATSATTQWVAPSGESGTTLLTAVVDDGQRLRIADVPVDFGQTQSMPKAGAEPILGLRRFADNSLLLPDDLDFVFTLFNPIDTRNGSYSCQGDGQQIPDGTVIEQFTDNDGNGVVSAGDTASLTFNDCADFDIIRNGTIDFSITNNEPVGATEVISYSVVMNYNETLPNEPEYVDFSANFDVVYEDGSNEINPDEAYTVSSSTEFVATINESGAVPSPINNGVRIRLPAGYQFQIRRFFESNGYAATGDFSAVVEEIANDQLTGNTDQYVLQITSPLLGEWTANLPGGPTEAGVPQGLGEPFNGDFTVVMGAADLSPPLQNYRFLNNGNAATPRVDVLFDSGQDGSFDVEVLPTWEDIFENRGLGGELQGEIDFRTIMVDGQDTDWGSAIPLAIQSEGDPASPDGEVSAVYVAQTLEDFFFRLDLVGTPDTANFQYDWVFVPYNEAETACPEVTVDLDQFGSTAEACQLFVFDANGAVLGGCGTDGTSQPVFAADGVLEAAVPLADLPLATHVKVFYGSAITAPPDLQNFDRSIPPFCVDLLD